MSIEDQVVKARSRKYPELYTAYQMWMELNEFKTRITNRIGAVERGDSFIDAALSGIFLKGGVEVARERTTPSGKLKAKLYNMGLGLEGLQAFAQEEMHAYGKYHPMWEWMVAIPGIAGNNAAKFLALVDDIARFDTIASLWRYSGYGIFKYWVDEEGRVYAPEYGYKSKRQKRKGEEVTVRWKEYAIPEEGWVLKKIADPPRNRRPSGWNAPDNTELRAQLYVMNEGMIRTKRGEYVDAYYAAKEKYLGQGKTKGHSHNSAFRIMSKELLRDFWLEFRKREGLPITEQWGAK